MTTNQLVMIVVFALATFLVACVEDALAGGTGR